MNYLAHAHLSGPDLRVEGICGDFVKGRLESIFDVKLRRGVCLHRRVDSFADQHPIGLRSRRRFGHRRRRFAGVIVDVLNDHFLALEWIRFSNVPLRCFVDEVYRELEANHHRLPSRLGGLVPAMIAEDWLGANVQFDSVQCVLDRIASRSPRAEPLRGAGQELDENYEALRRDFMEFFPQAMAFARSERRRLESDECDVASHEYDDAS